MNDRFVLKEEDIEFVDEVIQHGGQGSGNFGHEGRPGEVGGSMSEERLQEDLSLHNTYSDRWRSGSDYEARDVVIQLQKDNPALHNYLLKSVFGEELPNTVTLYRVGRVSSEGATSFFTKRSFAEAYQRRMGIEGIEEKSFNINDVYPSTEGGKEVWINLE